MPSTIRDLTELTAVASDDYVLISDTSDVTNRDKRISQTNLLGSSMLRTFSGGVNLVAPTAILNVGDPAGADTINASATNAAVGINRYIANSGGPSLIFRKSRHATIGSHTVVQSSDDLGRIFFYGSNGTAFDLGAAIIARVDGAPGAGDMPTRLEFQTSADGSATPTTVLTLGANNLATFAGGLAFGGAPQTTLSYFGLGSWTPVLRDATSGGNVAAVGSATGWYVRVGALVYASVNLQNINTAGMTAGNTLYLTGFPFPAKNATNYQAHGAVQANFFTFTQQLIMAMAAANSYALFVENVSGANPTIKTVAAITSTGADLLLSFIYLTD